MSDHKLDYKVDWSVVGNIVYLERRFSVDEKLMHHRSMQIDTDEKAIRAGLEHLGWTPPQAKVPDMPEPAGQRWMLTSLDVSAITSMVEWLKCLDVAELAIADEHTVYFTSYGGSDLVCNDLRITVWKMQKK